MNRKQRRALVAQHVGQSVQLTNAIQFAADSDGSGVPKVSMVAYTGAPVEQFWAEYPIVVDLSTAKAARVPLPILRDHDHGRVVGHVESFDVTGKSITASGLLSGGNGDTDEIIASAKNGFPWQMSIGGSRIRNGDMQFIDEGATVSVNGREFSGPIYVLKNQSIIEVSIVSIGADGDTSAAVAASRSISMTFKQWLKANGLQAAAASSPTTRANLLKLYRASLSDAAEGDGGDADHTDTGEDEDITATDADADDADDSDDDEAEDRVNQSANTGGRRLAASGTSNADIERRINAQLRRRREVAEILVNHPELAAQADRENWTPDRAALMRVRAQRPDVNPSMGTATSSARPMEAAMLMRCGMSGPRLEQAGYSQREIDAATGQQMRNASFRDAIALTLANVGESANFGRIDDNVIRRAFNASRRLEAAGASTASLPGIMSNVANRLLWDSFIAFQSAFPEIARREETGDFKQLDRYRITALGNIEQVGPDGRIKDAELSDERYSNQVKTYAQRVGVTREMMYNDDIGGMEQIARSLGRNAALGRERVGFTTLLANAHAGSFFNTTNGNTLTGSTSALGIGAYTAAEQLMLDQKDAGGQPILVTPAILLVGTALKVTAEQLMSERMVNETTTANVPKPANNPHAGKSKVVWSPFLNAQGVAGGSGTLWYLLADPRDVAAMSIAYLNGQDTPTIEQADLDFSMLGMQWRVVYDFGIAMADHRGIVRNAGA